MKCPMCHCVFIASIAPTDEAWGEPKKVDGYHCPRCGVKSTPEKLGQVGVKTFIEGLEHFAGQVKEQQSTINKQKKTVN